MFIIILNWFDWKIIEKLIRKKKYCCYEKFLLLLFCNNLRLQRNNGECNDPINRPFESISTAIPYSATNGYIKFATRIL
ncbi:hypothetical protein DERP_011432 [Dermatophagoides pteronyssinus]|uniref:Uncharacterized protein n=1 Tax=Dermatophagoides pteronyssinus TaxID=6956 RepID=A0ABQ8J594_DERPT|nr:hypothetical protein DERP_011432 [Dermatophagoides pteronyssinus]